MSPLVSQEVTHIVCDASHLQEFIKTVYGLSSGWYIHEEMLDNLERGLALQVTVESRESDYVHDCEIAIFEETGRHARIGFVLNDLCSKGHINPGIYLITRYKED